MNLGNHVAGTLYKPTEIAVKSKKEDGVAVSVFIPV
jgi:hypothetical protein